MTAADDNDSSDTPLRQCPPAPKKAQRTGPSLLVPSSPSTQRLRKRLLDSFNQVQDAPALTLTKDAPRCTLSLGDMEPLPLDGAAAPPLVIAKLAKADADEPLPSELCELAGPLRRRLSFSDCM